MNLQPSMLTPLLEAHGRMRATELYNTNNSDINEEFSEAQLFDLGTKYSEQYALVREKLGYLSSLSPSYFAYYLDLHSSNYKVVSSEHAEHVFNQMDSANHHFQLQAYAQIAKVCCFALLFTCSFALFAAMLPAAIVPAAGYFSFNLATGACALSGTIAGLSGYGLFGAASKITPSAEDMISYQPFLG